MVTSFMRNRANAIMPTVKKENFCLPFFFFGGHSLLAAASKCGGADHHNYSARSLICSFTSPRGRVSGVFWGFWTAEGAKPPEGARPSQELPGIPGSPAGAALGSDVPALPAPLTNLLPWGSISLLRAKVFSLCCAIGTRCYLSNLKPRFVIRMLQGRVTKLKAST